jgi:hypothetical protein
MSKSSQLFPFPDVIRHDLLDHSPWFYRVPRPGAIPRCSSVTEGNALLTDPAMRYSPDLPTSEERPLGDHGCTSPFIRIFRIFSAFAASTFSKMKRFKLLFVHGGRPDADASPLANRSADRNFPVG